MTQAGVVTANADETTQDRFLDGAFVLMQRRRGAHRCGSDAILLAATVSGDAVGRTVDLGSGPGAAGFAVAVRTRSDVVLVDMDAESLALAAASLRLPENAGFANRIGVVQGDIEGPVAEFTELGLAAGSADRVIANPPFFEHGRHRAAPSDGRARARMLGEAGLSPWLKRAAHLLRPSGSLHLILPASLLAQALSLMEGRFGAVDILPVHARPNTPADRILVTAIKGSRAGLRIVPGLVMHEPDGRYSDAASRILRAGAAIDRPPR
ncbi:tRNA1(Val) (adenine(37)-N6)-methyltransferase [Amorphus orientalis]|uniref:tRNA1(Val) A37 N6-methylase TrmN6 n=1 Tax=Amorphus orientalis TaxID=649198 RepID=A0AAE3VPP4_9HYPH|nr:methyltransferase [Amorphus orientalis]MDQ0315856.1 tRNA1(Val) A37 N6-methylase TrmN6 [Amorphus orientalis]